MSTIPEFEFRLLRWISSILDPVDSALNGLLSLEKKSLDRLRHLDAAEFLRPSLVVREALQKKFPEDELQALPSDLRMIERVRARDVALCQFFLEVDRICASFFQNTQPIFVTFLAGDSHNGGRRPLRLDTLRDAFVIKFAEPRAYQILADIAACIGAATGFTLGMPQILAHNLDPAWYILPYLSETRQEECFDVTQFIAASGALTALAFSLWISDVHLENLLVWNGIPVVIDPECIFSFLSTMKAEDRLLSTGLLSQNVHLSALRGGSVPLFVLAHSFDQSGVLRYRHTKTDFRNRLQNAEIVNLDPADHASVLLEAFRRTYCFIVQNKGSLIDLIQTYVTDDFRVRCLVRKTRHYVTIIEMLNLPQSDEGTKHQEMILERFRSSGSFERTSDRLISAEISDLLAGDVPYFWYTAGSRSLHHCTGVVAHDVLDHSLKESITDIFTTMGSEDLELQLDILKKFLGTPLSEAGFNAPS